MANGRDKAATDHPLARSQGQADQRLPQNPPPTDPDVHGAVAPLQSLGGRGAHDLERSNIARHLGRPTSVVTTLATLPASPAARIELAEPITRPTRRRALSTALANQLRAVCRRFCSASRIAACHLPGRSSKLLASSSASWNSRR